MTLALQIFFWWAAFGLVAFPVLYVGYGFVRSAVAGRDNKLSPSPPLVLKVDLFFSAFFVLLDGVLNITHMTVFCIDFWPQRAFKRYKIKGITIIAPELITERCNVYSLDDKQFKFRKYIADVFAGWTASKEPRGWHVAGEHQRIDWLYGSESK